MSFIQIQAGVFARKRIEIPRHSAVRPTSDRVKTSLFAILEPIIEHHPFVDVFSGSGAVGFEALSRGSPHVILIEKNPQLIQSMRANAIKLSCPPELTIIQGCALKHLPKIRNDCPNAVFFIDPPYDSDLTEKILKILDKGIDGWAITESHHKTDLECSLNQLMPFRSERYGETRLVFWRNKAFKEI
mgnify:CR=1 FL=1